MPSIWQWETTRRDLIKRWSRRAPRDNGISKVGDTGKPCCFFFVFFFRTLLLLESFTVTFKEFASCFVASGFQETGVCLRAPSCFGCFVVLPWPPGHFLPFFFLFLILSLSLTLMYARRRRGEGGCLGFMRDWLHNITQHR